MTVIIIVAIIITGLLISGGIIIQKKFNTASDLGISLLLFGSGLMLIFTGIFCEVYKESLNVDKLKQEALKYGYAKYIIIQPNKTDKPIYEWRWNKE